MLMWIHPIIQAVATLLGAYVLFMGFQRFRFQHLKQKCQFNWKRHVHFGKIALWLWLVGFTVGVFMAHHAWGSVNLTGPHYTVAILMLPLLAVAAITGLALQKPKGKRAGLALLHGSANTLLFAMACYQGWSGIEVIRQFLLG